MLYTFTKFLIRLGLIIFFRKILFQDKQRLYEEGPLLLACNHPNSFLDALIIGSFFKHPVHFLARGDAFKNPLAKKILTALKVIPIYRLKEGKEHLALNDTTFERCTEILTKGGIVLIFSEGLCINQWKLRPLKKGTARIALNALKQSEISAAFRILPVSLNYSSFTRFRKNVIIDFSQVITQHEISIEKRDGEQIIELNKLIYSRLDKGLIIEENNNITPEFLLSNISFFTKDHQKLIQTLKVKQCFLKNDFDEYLARLSGTKKVASGIPSLIISLLLIPLLFIPALVGLLVHLPLYIPLNNFIKNKTEGTVFYHSTLFGALIISYPFYVFIISLTLTMAFNNLVFFLCLLMLPFLAFIFLFWKDCFESVINYCRLPASIRKGLED